MDIMHGEDVVASINKNGTVTFFMPDLMPYDLYLEECIDDIDIMVQNLDNFYHWCASRLIPVDRKYLKEIFGSIGATQRMTDKDRATVSLSYNALSLTDIYWVRGTHDARFSDINLFDHASDMAYADISLSGKQKKIDDSYLIAGDLGTSGVFPKAWIKEDDYYLLKDGDEDAVEREIIAGSIVSRFDVPQVIYTEDNFNGIKVSKSKIITSKKYGIVTMEAFQIYAVNHDIDPMDEILRLDAKGYYMMNIIDYLIGNTDRHWGNWGWLIDNDNGERLRLHELMDFNRSFMNYDDINGGVCQTLFSSGKTDQREAAIHAAKKIGFDADITIDDSVFGDRDGWREMFHRRLNEMHR